MGIELAECSDCKAMNAPRRTACRCCGASLSASSQQAAFGGGRRKAKRYPTWDYPTLEDMVEEVMKSFGPKAFSFSPTVFGFKGLFLWGLLLLLVIYLAGWFAAVLVLAFLFLVYAFITFSDLVFTMLDVAAGEIAEIRHDLLKMQESIPRKEH